MKKSLIALAVMAASGGAFAQSVTLYGLVDAWVGVNKASDGVSATGTVSNSMVGSGGVDGSRWGMKGSEDLGGGLKANFKLEQGFSIDTGAAGTTVDFTKPGSNIAGTQAFSRYSYVSLSGAFGEVKLGKTGTAYDDATGVGNAVFNSALSAEANTFKSTTLYTWNPANTILYATPEMSGFSAEVSYSLGENKTTTVGAGNVTSFNVTYATGPLYASLGYQTEKADGNAKELKFTELNGKYDFGVAALKVAYGKVQQDGVLPTTNEYQIGVDYPVSSALVLSANYARSKDDAFGAMGEVKRSGYGLGAAYNLSKRTFVYGGYRAETNDQGGAGDLKTSLFAVGVHHTF